ncbi:YezD family protein [Novosphingobium flavum]|uniref:YezD family protein n=1 Tax=Novosphingobium flavum TaxID=1778672 RepID=A0A7X1FSM0_9SPHN|nr:YezD family protein [Novosphingobium flavum]MBC2666205.1 YezD family protein [Novosphingobium flavum]
MAQTNHAGHRDGAAPDKAAQFDRSAVIEAVTAAIGRLRYGAIELTVHDGRVVQLEVTERQRFS